MKRVGLTGGIASGKTMVASVFEKLNVPVYYADKRAGELINSSKAIITELKKLLGDDIYSEDGVSKELLSRYIFHHPEIKEKIENIVHPEVMDDWNQWCAKTGSNYVVMESALLFQTGYYRQMNAIVVTEAAPEVRRMRLSKRDSISNEEAALRIQSQGFVVPESMDIPVFVIRNQDDRDMLLIQVLKLHETLLNS